MIKIWHLSEKSKRPISWDIILFKPWFFPAVWIREVRPRHPHLQWTVGTPGGASEQLFSTVESVFSKPPLWPFQHLKVWFVFGWKRLRRSLQISEMSFLGTILVFMLETEDLLFLRADVFQMFTGCCYLSSWVQHSDFKPSVWFGMHWTFLHIHSDRLNVSLLVQVSSGTRTRTRTGRRSLCWSFTCSS